MQDEVWQAVLGEIELSISRGSFVTWFKRTRLLTCSDDCGGDWCRYGLH
jgi:hypothetical protein